jgi:hypothetical protein
MGEQDVSHDRGLRLQNALAAYLRHWWPLAESAGAGRNGTDVTNTPGVVWESKTAREFKPTMFVRQAKASAGRALPVVVYWPDGCGDKSAPDALAILPLRCLMLLLEEAEYTP